MRSGSTPCWPRIRGCWTRTCRSPTTRARCCSATRPGPRGVRRTCGPCRPMHLQLIPALHRATHRVGLYLDALRAHGLTQGEAHLLAHLAQVRAATVGELHEVLAHKRSTLTSILDRLVERGLVTRQAGVADRRTFVIDTTAKGQRVAADVRRHLAALEAAVGRQVTAAEINAFLKVLAAVEEEARKATLAAPTRR